MTDGEPSKVKLETWLLVGFIVALLLSTTVIIVTSADKDTVYSAYVTDADTIYSINRFRPCVPRLAMKVRIT